MVGARVVLRMNALSLFLSLYPALALFFFLPISLSISLSFSSDLSLYLFPSLSICLSLSLSLSLPLFPSLSLSFPLSPSLSLYLAPCRPAMRGVLSRRESLTASEGWKDRESLARQAGEQVGAQAGGQAGGFAVWPFLPFRLPAFPAFYMY
jgi:hypothetical protein